MGFYQSFLEGLRSSYGEGRRFRTEAELARFVGVEPAQIHKYTHSITTKNLEKLGNILDKLGAKLVFPDSNQEDNAKDVCFVNARVVPTGDGHPPPYAEDYMAVPLVEEVGAGLGIIPQGELKAWFLVWKNQDAVRYRRDLIAVQIDKTSKSMLPTLAPRDIVLVDRQDRNVERHGHIMLVMDSEGAGMIKRVAVEELKKDFRITYYSDNTANHAPIVYSLRDDFLGDWDRAIVGRVVCAWSDVSNK